MIEENFLLPECYIDTELVRTIRARWPNHILGIGNVANKMRDEKQRKKILIGIVDNDKKQPPYFKEFKQVKGSDSNILKKHPENNHYLIVICPAAEVWLLNCAEAIGVDAKFKTLKAIMDVSKHPKVDPRIKDLLNTLLQKKAEPMMEIKAWIEELLP